MSCDTHLSSDYQGGQGIGGRGWYSASASASGWQADAKSFEESRYRKLLGGCDVVIACWQPSDTGFAAVSMNHIC